MMVILIKMIFSVTSEKSVWNLVMGQKASEIHVLWVPQCNLLPELLKKEVFGNCMVHSPLIWKQRTVCSKWLIFIMPKFHTFLFALEKTFKLDKKKNCARLIYLYVSFPHRKENWPQIIAFFVGVIFLLLWRLQ